MSSTVFFNEILCGIPKHKLEKCRADVAEARSAAGLSSA